CCTRSRAFLMYAVGRRGIASRCRYRHAVPQHVGILRAKLLELAMATSWTRETVQSLAPDASSFKSALGLAKAREWQCLELSDRALWGEIKGSGKAPYQTRIDLSAPAFKCSCPSRKFPCKHGLALMLLHVEDPSAFKSTDPPEWVTAWLSGREQRAE